MPAPTPLGSGMDEESGDGGPSSASNSGMLLMRGNGKSPIIIWSMD